MKIAIHGKPFSKDLQPTIKNLLDALLERQTSLVISSLFAKDLREAGILPSACKVYKPDEYEGDSDFFFTLGGDGTLLEAVTHIKGEETPILGINTGRLGFLATTSKDMIENAVEAVFEKHYTYDDRTLIKLKTNEDIFSGINFALNDFTILKKDSSSMIVVHTYIDGECPT